MQLYSFSNDFLSPLCPPPPIQAYKLNKIPKLFSLLFFAWLFMLFKAIFYALLSWYKSQRKEVGKWLNTLVVIVE